MDLGLKDKCALVLASSSGLGKAVAKNWRRKALKSCSSALFEEQLEEAQEEITAETGNENVAYYCGDMTKAEDIKALVKAACDKFGPIYALFNNAGGPPAGPLNSFDDEAWYRAFDLTLLSYQRVVRGLRRS